MPFYAKNCFFDYGINRDHLQKASELSMLKTAIGTVL